MKKRRNFIKYNIRIEKNIKIYDKKFLKEFEIASNTIKQKIEETSPSTLNMKRMQSIFELMYNNTFHEKFSSQDLEKIIIVIGIKKNIHEETAFIILKIKDLINQQEKISANIDEL